MLCTESEFIKLSYTANDFPGLAAVVDSLFFPRDSEDQWPVRLGEIFNEYETLVSETGHVWILDFLSFSNEYVFFSTFYFPYRISYS